MHVKTSATALLLVIVVILLLVSGCAAKEPGTLQDQREPADGSRLTGQVTIPERPGTFPVTPGYTPQVTVSPALYENITQVQATLTAIAGEWSPQGLSCSDMSCEAHFVDSEGDVVIIRSLLYGTADEAHAAFLTAMDEAAEYRVKSVEAGDEAYAWQHLSTSELGFRKSNLLVITTYISAKGPASLNDVITVATAVSGSLK
jgi:hypothetical protein